MTKQKTPVFRHHYNSTPDTGEINNMPSMTVPGMAMTIPEIIKRFAQGLPMSAPRVPEFTGEDDPLQGVNWNTLDLSEKHIFVQGLKSDLRDLDQKFKDQETRLKQEAAEKLRKQKEEKELKKQPKALGSPQQLTIDDSEA